MGMNVKRRSCSLLMKVEDRLSAGVLYWTCFLAVPGLAAGQAPAGRPFRTFMCQYWLVSGPGGSVPSREPASPVRSPPPRRRPGSRRAAASAAARTPACRLAQRGELTGYQAVSGDRARLSEHRTAVYRSAWCPLRCSTCPNRIFEPTCSDVRGRLEPGPRGPDAAVPCWLAVGWSRQPRTWRSLRSWSMTSRSGAARTTAPC